MTSKLIAIVLLLNGTVQLQEYSYVGTIHECFDMGEKLRIKTSTYYDQNNTWYLNDGSGTWHGFICE